MNIYNFETISDVPDFLMNEKVTVDECIDFFKVQKINYITLCYALCCSPLHVFSYIFEKYNGEEKFNNNFIKICASYGLTDKIDYLVSFKDSFKINWGAAISAFRNGHKKLATSMSNELLRNEEIDRLKRSIELNYSDDE